MRRKFSAVVLFLTFVVSVLAVWAWIGYRHAMYAPAVSNQAVLVDIGKGDSLRRIAEKIAQQNVDIKPLWFRFIAYRQHAAAKLKAGEYELTPGMTVPQIIALLAQGKTKQYAITFPEGWTFKQIVQALAARDKIAHELQQTNDAEMLAKLRINEAHPEGLFFPDTYYFEKNMTDVSILQRAYREMQKVLRQEWEQRDPDLPLRNAYEALIMASIVEKETGIPAERPKIAGVFMRRLQKGMLLQTDPTVIYGMGDQYHGDIKSEDLKAATPYNTYVIEGLPPTPIAIPGRASLHAALHPEKGEALYFVARGDGTHVFSTTLEEHQRAVNAFRQNHE